MVNTLNTYQTEIDPVFNRDGEYLLGDKCWFEVRGRAFLMRKQDFLYKLRQLCMAEHDCAVIKSLDDIARLAPNLLTKEQLALISDYGRFLHKRIIKRESLKRRKEIKGVGNENK